MAQSNTKRGPGFGLIIGLALGIFAAIIFKKLAVALFLGIIIALLLYRVSK